MALSLESLLSNRCAKKTGPIRGITDNNNTDNSHIDPHPHPQLPPSGSYRCGKNCATCPYICDGLRTNYTSFSTGETRPIKSNLTCETKNLIYMIQCNRCNLQYIGETKRRLKDRFALMNTAAP